jgi:fatty acid synthase
VILKKSEEEAKQQLSSTGLPRLFTYAGRTKAAVEGVLKFVEDNAGDVNVYNLLMKQANLPANQQPFRGFAVLHQGIKQKEITQVSPDSRPVWFIYSGMGSQWPGMGKTLLQFDVCKQALQKCAAVLKPLGLNVIELLTEATEETFESPKLSFICILSMQIALTDLLKQVGVEPEGFVGHSVGELGCGYADGTLTAEEAMLCAYWRGKTIEDSKLPPGATAAVGLTWEEAGKRCPKGVVPACHNAEDSVTISGPAADVEAFVNQLTAEGVFARMVKSSGVAFHSYFMQQIAGKLREALEKVVTSP